MKTTIFTFALILLIGCAGYSFVNTVDNTGRQFVPINIGYFIVIAGAFVSVALFSDVREENTRVRYEIYRQLSKGELSMDNLMEGLSKELTSGSYNIQILRTTISIMLDQGHLVCSEGTIKMSNKAQ